MKTQLKKYSPTAGIAASLLLALLPIAKADIPLGAHVDQFKLECSGTLIVSDVERVTVTKGLHDRAGNYHPPKGFIDLKLKIKSLTSGCLKMKETLGVDFSTKPLITSFFSKNTDKQVLQTEATSHLGKIVEFKTNHHFSYVTKEGFLPYFPLLHKEIVTLKSELPFDVSQSYVANNPGLKKFLYNEDLVQLTNTLFEHFEKNGLQQIGTEELLLALMGNPPSFQKDFRTYLGKVLVLYKQLENNRALPNEYGFHFDFKLSSIASELAKLTHKNPHYYEFNLPELIAQHPSFLTQYGNFPNISTQNLEHAIDLIEKNLTEGHYSAAVKLHFKEPLKEMAGHFGPGGTLSKMSSKYIEEKAKKILSLHYENKK